MRDWKLLHVPVLMAGEIPRSFLYLREQRAKLAELVLPRLEEIYGSSYFMNLHAGEKTQGNGERTNLICAYFVRYCKYDIFQGEMSKNVEIGRLHKDFLKMWIGELVRQKFSTFQNMEKR